MNLSQRYGLVNGWPAQPPSFLDVCTWLGLCPGLSFTLDPDQAKLHKTCFLRARGGGETRQRDLGKRRSPASTVARFSVISVVLEGFAPLSSLLFRSKPV